MSQQKGLGKGLSALISESYSSSIQAQTVNRPAPEGGFTLLPLDSIIPGRFQPRRKFDASVLQELASSIAQSGVMQPVIVRPCPDERGKYELVAGERRWRAAGMAGLSGIPAIIREISDKSALELGLIENVQRQDLNPLEEAAGYQQLIDAFHYTQDELSDIIGKSRSHIANLLRLLALPDRIKELLMEDKLTMGHARALLAAPDPDSIALEVVRQGLNVRETEDLIRRETGREKGQRPRAGVGNGQRATGFSANSGGKAKDEDILALEASLSENLGLRVSINDRGHQGEILIGYDSLAQLDEVLRRLGGGSF
jgi:ParB family chromosome partitioning protein